LPSRVLPGPLPRLPSGKVDYPRLSARAASGGERTSAATGADAPRERTRTEDTLSRIWAHTLGRDYVSVDDDFFALGGDSFLAVKVVAETHRQLSPVVRLRDLFASPTVRAIAALVDAPPRALLTTSRDAEALRHDVRLPIDVTIPGEGPPSDEGSRRASPHVTPPRRAFLTGATGFVGAHVLADLLDTGLEAVYCLVRAEDEATARRRLEEALGRRGLRPSGLNRVIPIVGALERRCFGI